MVTVNYHEVVCRSYHFHLLLQDVVMVAGLMVEDLVVDSLLHHLLQRDGHCLL
jgi:hypothetical protein